MKYNIQTFINELLDNQIIDESVAHRISDHYAQKVNTAGNSRMLGIFGVLGALLVGGGLILIVAHNWDNLSRNFQSILSFVPVLIGLGACGFSLLKQSDSFAWKEASAVFLTFAFGACVGLISQIYNIPGSLKGYMLTWVVAVLPLIYLMNSRITSLLYLIGVTAYGVTAGYEGDNSFWDHYGHWILLAGVMPFYFNLLADHSKSNATYFHHWLLPIGIAILLGTITTDKSWWLLPSYYILFGCYYLLSNTTSFRSLSLFSNGYRIVGSLGMIIMLLVYSFYGPWEPITNDQPEIVDHLTSSYFVLPIILLAIAGYLFYLQQSNENKNIMDFGFIVFPIIFITALFSALTATILANIFVLVLAIGTIFKGSEANHLGIVNYGLLTITALIICRFFDVDIPFFIRGLLFIGVGAAFFFVNYKIIQKRKSSTNF